MSVQKALPWDSIQGNAVSFSKRWEGAYNEEAQGQSFILDFFRVFGVADPERTGDFEYKVPLEENRTGYIDYLWKKRIAVEMKSRGKDLKKAYEQLKEYVFHLPEEDMPDLLMVCDFATIILHRRTTGEKASFKTKDLRKHIRKFAGIAGYKTTRAYDNQIEVNVKAAEKMARLHDALREHGYEGHELRVYLVRLLFCMFADDSGIFPQNAFQNYVENSKDDGGDLSERIGKLFEVLNMSDEVRKKRTLLSADLLLFRYINGGLFKDYLPTAEFDAAMRRLLIDCCAFDWSTISPAIFGAMFQGVMDKAQRRELGAHYTSEENILKLINPLFMDELWQEFDRVKTDPTQLDRFHEKISGLKFLDPACGCGNFLIITYRELRVLELEVLKMKVGSSQYMLDIDRLLKVNVEQFYGIELEDFPCQIAQVGMWLMDHLMNLRVAEQFGVYVARLPLTQSAHIVNGNALRLDWKMVVPKGELSYILGNPPFLGYSNQNEEQKSDILSVYLDKNGKSFKAAGKLDYVAAWYYKAAEYLSGTKIRAAFVSTNSITQGEQVVIVWSPLFDMFGIHIDFAYRTFKWSNDATGKAAVHCVIIGFSATNNNRKYIFEDMTNSLMIEMVRRINNNPYFQIIQNTVKNQTLQSIQKMADNPVWKVANNSIYQAIQKMANNPVYQSIQKVADNPVWKIANNPAYQAIQKMVNNPAYQAIQKMADNPVWKMANSQVYQGIMSAANNISPYLVDAPTIFVESRKTPLCDVPLMMTGNRPADGGHLIIEDDDLADFIKADPLSEKYIRRFMGSEEFINNKKRWCLWLVGISPDDLRRMPEVMKRIAACKKDREYSSDEGRRKLATTPMLFREQVTSEKDFIVIQAVSSERRSYVPIGFLPPSIIVSNLVTLIPNATLYHFGILTSSVHMAWVRAVCGRLKSDYRYSKDIVYNNFPWPDATDEQKVGIEKLARGILDARMQFPESSLADLYDPLTMPPELVKAHQNLDRAVMKTYGFKNSMTEAQCVAALMGRYKIIAEE